MPAICPVQKPHGNRLQLRPMELLDNTDLLFGDDLKQTLPPGARLKVAASCFSM